jgi:hypothetical protein
MKLKRFALILISCLIITPLLFSGTAYAQEEELPDPGITPDSPFYFFDVWSKNIGLFFAFGNEAKARKALEYAEERLSEAEAMAVKNRIREVVRAAGDYDEFMAMVNQKTQEQLQQGVTDNVSEIVALATAKHLSVLDRVKDKVPDAAKEAVIRAREASLNGQENALRALARERLERAMEINLAAIENRLNRARTKASQNATEEVEEALDDAEKLSRFGEEISEIARGLGENTTTVEELTAKANSVHLDVLTRIYEKVPEQAKPAIERALSNAIRNRERVIEALKNKGALGDIPEEAPELERIQEKVLERIRERVQENIQQGGVESTPEQLQEKVPGQLREEVREKAREQISNLKPETPQPVASENETEEQNEVTPRRVRTQNP